MSIDLDSNETRKKCSQTVRLCCQQLKEFLTVPYLNLDEECQKCLLVVKGARLINYLQIERERDNTHMATPTYRIISYRVFQPSGIDFRAKVEKFRSSSIGQGVCIDDYQFSTGGNVKIAHNSQ